MAVKIRLARYGRIHRPFFRVVAIDERFHREGKAAEILGTYDPLLAEKNVQVNLERVHAWIRQGAVYSAGAMSLIRKAGYQLIPTDVLEARTKQKDRKAARRAKAQKSDGKTWVAPKRRALRKHAATLKSKRLSEAKAAAEAKKAAAAAEAPAAEG